MPDEIPGINMLVAVDGTAVVAQSNATLTTSPELAEAVVKNTNFTEQRSGDQDWSLSYEGQITDDQAKHALSNGNAGLDVEVDLGSGLAFEPVPGLQTITLTLEQELTSVPPGINEATGWVYYVPLRRSWSVEVEGHYYDPGGSTDGEQVYQKIHEARDAGDTLPAEVSVLGATMAGDIAADSMDVEAGTDDQASYALSFMGSGAVTKNGTFETTIASLIDLYFNQSEATAALRHETDGSVVSGSTLWEGTALVSSLEIELARNAYPTLSAELQGDGELTRTTQ